MQLRLQQSDLQMEKSDLILAVVRINEGVNHRTVTDNSNSVNLDH